MNNRKRKRQGQLQQVMSARRYLAGLYGTRISPTEAVLAARHLRAYRANYALRGSELPF